MHTSSTIGSREAVLSCSADHGDGNEVVASATFFEELHGSCCRWLCEELLRLQVKQWMRMKEV